MLDLLDKIDIEGLVLTGDAIFSQKNICNKIVDKGGDFVFTVKENQKHLRHTIQAATGAAQAAFSPKPSTDSE